MNAGTPDSVSPNVVSSLDVCRLCGTHDAKLIDVYSEEGLQNDIPNKIKLYIPVQLLRYEELSVVCCLECIATVLSWHDFVQKALDTAQRYNSQYDKLEAVSQDVESNHGFSEHTSTITEINIADDFSGNLNISGDRIVLTIDNNEIYEENGTNCRKEHLLHSADDLAVKSEDFEIGSSSRVFRTVKVLKPEAIVDKFTCEICNKSFKRKHFMDKHMKTKHLNVNFNTTNNLMSDTVPQEKSEIITDSIVQVQSDTDDPKIEKIDQEKLSGVIVGGDILQDIQSSKLTNSNEHKKAVKIRRKKVEVEDRFFCDKCSKGFTRNFDMRRHVAAKHPEVKLDDSFSSKKNCDILNKCKIIKDGKTFYECDICNHRTKQSYNLMRHRTIHSGGTPFVCHICGRRFRLDTALRKHIQQTHDRLKKFKCGLCQKNFGLKSARDEHMNIHFDNRPFSCDICQKSFKQKSSMYIHKLYHTDNYKYSCQVCDKKFRRSQELVHHNRIHTGHKPFSCDECGARFRLGQDLKRHSRIHLRTDEEWVCDDCHASFSQERYLKLHSRIHN